MRKCCFFRLVLKIIIDFRKIFLNIRIIFVLAVFLLNFTKTCCNIIK